MRLRLSHLWRSSLIQISLLFVLFTSAMLWQYVFDPIISNHLLSQQTANLERINLNVVSDYLSRTDKENIGQYGEDDTYAKAIFEANPALHYYKVYKSGDVISSGRYPQWLGKQNVEGLKRFSRQHSTSSECLQLSKSDTFVDADGLGRYQLRVCGREVEYEELSGLANPVSESPWQVLVHSFSASEDGSLSKRYIYVGAGVFLLAVGVMCFGYWSLRRLSRVVDSFSLEHRDNVLPSKDVPLEAVPLIDALNNLMARLDEHEQQRSFFLSTAAHEIRDPLTVLRMQMEDLPECPEKTKVIHSIRDLTSLTNQLLTLLKVASWEVSDDATDLVSACEKSIKALSDKAELQSVTVNFKTEHSNWYIVGNDLLIELAITNVIKNAISFTPHQGQVDVELDERGVIHVYDQGKGFDPSKADQLFEPFCKYPPNRNGHGLGLAIVKAVVQLHQGRATIENNHSSGAHVCLRLFPKNALD